jgi:uncharacterized protein DUF1559
VIKASRLQRLICVVLAVSMAVGPSLNVWAQPAAEVKNGAAKAAAQPPAAPAGMLDTTYVAPGAVVFVSLRPAQLMKSPMGEFLPTEVATAAGIKYLGIDPANVEEASGFVDLSNPMAPNYAVALKFAQPLGGLKLPQELRQHTQLGELAGKRYLKSQIPMAPSFFPPNNRTLLAAPEETLKQLIEKPAADKTSPMLDRLRKVTAGSDLYVAVDIASLRPLIQMGLAQAQRDIPPQAQKYLEAVNLLSAAELTVNLSNAAPTSLVVHANDENAAQQIEKLIADAAEETRAQMKAQLAQQAASEDPVERAFAQYMERVSGKWTQPFLPKRAGTSLTFFRIEGNNSSQQQLVTTAVIGVLIALLLPAVQAAREAARRTQSMNNMKQQMLALLNHESAKKAFPAHAIYKDGKPLLSWRVQILPYIEQQALYEQFHLDEPWDSEHNRALIQHMPQVYANPNMPLQAGKTNYLAVVGKDCVFDGTDKGMQLRNITDGTSKTIALVEADPAKAVEWTKPDDWQFDPNNPSAGLGHIRAGGWLSAFADGSVQFISSTIDQNMLKAFFTRAGGEAGGF